jgi:opacity protein-like surface antigen
MKKFLLLLLLLIFFSPRVEAMYYYNLPESLDLEEMNSQEKKTQTRIDSAEKIPSQYKGKLVYHPATTDNLKSYRKGRVFISFYGADLVPTLSNMHYNNNVGKQETSVSSSDRNEYTFLIGVGYYEYDNMALELEYITLKTTINLSNNISDKKGNSINTILFDTQGYFGNVTFESNYSRFIPFFGFGIGFLTYNITNTFLNDAGVQSSFGFQSSFAYNLFFGMEVALGNNFFLGIKHKTIVSEDFNITSDGEKRDKIKFDFKNSFFTIGIKYLW